MASTASDRHPRSSIFQDRTGSDQSPIDKTFYNVLNVSPTASSAEIKKAYYSLSLQYHPDRTQSHDEATRREYAERFKTISQAYTILSDPEKRILYNKFGRDERVLSNDSSAFSFESFDAGEFFRFMFGGDEFQPVVGDFELAETFKSAISEMVNGSTNRSERNLTEAEKFRQERAEIEERRRARERRIENLSRNLREKLNLFTEECRGEKSDFSFQRSLENFTRLIEKESEELIKAPYGENLLHSIGYVYSSKARLWSTKMDTEESSWKKRVVGHTKHFQSTCQDRFHVARETFKTIKSAVKWGQSVSRLAQATEDESDEETNDFNPHAARLEYSGSARPEQIEATKSNRKSSSRQVAPVTEEEKRRLEGDMAAKSMQALWQAVKLEIESVQREVCDRILNESNFDRRILRLRCVALSRIGEIWQQIRST